MFSLINRAGTPPINDLGGKLLVTTEPAAITDPSPMVTPFKMITRLPIHTLFPITMAADEGIRLPSTTKA